MKNFASKIKRSKMPFVTVILFSPNIINSASRDKIIINYRESAGQKDSKMS